MENTPHYSHLDKTPKTTSFTKYFLFASIALVAVVSMALAVFLPKQSADQSTQAWSSINCAGEVGVARSGCSEGCGVDQDCSSGYICYRSSGASTGDGVCRNSSNPSNTYCASGSSATTPPSSTTNILQNSGFDTALSPWVSKITSAAGSVSLVAGDRGTGKVVLLKTTTAYPASPHYVQLSQPISITGGKTYTLKFWAKASSSSTPLRAVVQQANSPYTELSVSSLTLTAAWSQYSYSFSVPSSETAAAVRFNAAGKVGSIWIDDVILQ